MPWHVMKTNAQCPFSKPWAVISDQTGKPVPGGCHATKEEADQHMKAIYANTPDSEHKK